MVDYSKTIEYATSQLNEIKSLHTALIQSRRGGNAPDSSGTLLQARKYCQLSKAILAKIYGSNAQKLKDFDKAVEEQDTQGRGFYAAEQLPSICISYLESMLAEIQNDLVISYQKQITGEIFSDFILLSENALDNSKDVAAVLICAAFEDAVKRVCVSENIDTNDKELSDLVNALKGKQYFSGPQSGIVDGIKKLRNKAMHAEWNKFEKAEVGSAIAFTKQFLLENFS